MHAILGEGAVSRLLTNPEHENPTPYFLLPQLGIFYLLIIFMMSYSQGAKFHIWFIFCKHLFFVLGIRCAQHGNTIDHTMARYTHLFLLV